MDISFRITLILTGKALPLIANNFMNIRKELLLVRGPSLEVIKLEFILRLKIKRIDWLFAISGKAKYKKK